MKAPPPDIEALAPICGLVALEPKRAHGIITPGSANSRIHRGAKAVLLDCQKGYRVSTLQETENISPESPPQEGEGSGQRTRFIILGAVLALAVGYMVFAAFPGNVLYFLTVSEFMRADEYRDGRTIRVSGALVDGSFHRQEKSTYSNFQLADKEGGAPERLVASYVGVMPDLFFNPHSEIILEGRYGPDDVFEAESILVKCPSKYRALEEEESAQG